GRLELTSPWRYLEGQHDHDRGSALPCHGPLERVLWSWLRFISRRFIPGPGCSTPRFARSVRSARARPCLEIGAKGPYGDASLGTVDPHGKAFIARPFPGSSYGDAEEISDLFPRTKTLRARQKSPLPPAWPDRVDPNAIGKPVATTRWALVAYSYSMRSGIPAPCARIAPI